MRTVSETSGTTLNEPTIQIVGVPEEEKEKGLEKTFEEIIVENFLNTGNEIVTQVQEVQSPIQNKPKEEHAKIRINQTNKNQTQRKKN